MPDLRRHPGEAMLAAWIPEDLHGTLKAKLKRERIAVREFLIHVATKYTGFQKPEEDNGAPPVQES